MRWFYDTISSKECRDKFPVGADPSFSVIKAYDAAFKVHPYRHPTIGWLADLQSMTRDELYQYYRSHYVPNNATPALLMS